MNAYPLMFVALLAALPAGPALAAEPSARDLRAAQCVAALDASTHDLAAQVRAGNSASRRLLMDRLVSGAAFIGDSYLHGRVNEDQARQLTDQAREAQRKLPAPELAARQTSCADEGGKLYAAGNSLQQAVVKRLAKRRMERLLGG
jgi:hypothetical protein